MRPIRSLLPLLRQQRPSLLLREAAWRLAKTQRAARLRTMIRRGEPNLQFRQIPYYRPNLSALRDETPVIASFADLICSGDFPFLGYEIAQLGIPPKWNVDFITSFEWEQWPARELVPVVRYNGSDVKVPWEMSRLQFLPVLGKAYLLTGNASYREAAMLLFADWCDKNPVGVGVNWTLAMESALRGMSLCFLMSLLQPLQPSEQAWADKLTQSIWQHLLYTEATLEFSHLIRGNHYLANIVGLYCMASFLEAPGMAVRRKTYLCRIEQEIFHQVYEDGGDYEASFGYHFFVLQLFTCSFLLMRANGVSPSTQFTVRLHAMFRYLETLSGQSKCVPHVGDSDDGRAEILASDIRQMVSLPPQQRDSLHVSSYLALGSALFDLAGEHDDDSDCAWFGLQPRQRSATSSRLVLFPKSGVAVARRNDVEVIFCAIPNGIGGFGSHTHNDKLSVIANICGIELLNDPGTCWYTRDIVVRNSYRSTRAHNTVTVDGEEQNDFCRDPRFEFSISNQAHVSAIQACETEDEIALCSEHSGYRRIGILHRRMVRIRSREVTIEDMLEGSDEHGFEVYWNLPNPWRVVTENADGFEIAGPIRVSLRVQSNLAIACSHADNFVSRTYGGVVEKGTRLKIYGRGCFPCQIVTTIHWGPADPKNRQSFGSCSATHWQARIHSNDSVVPNSANLSAVSL